ncbi:hypothetical protein RHSIM_Rhsim12G0012100 [Rhododendron simsii]|uniref:Uncharacterized protein n=1 Tax=Rhododendron simsii TaxID=118357 RepID=A0A834G1Z9_RHOSS|nr:hypothetical protein RHSIM_Rhsim12G0012100 [Rhododendron simsii]
MQPPPPQPDEEDDEYIDVVEASDQWSEWRATLANQMFNEWQANRGQNGGVNDVLKLSGLGWDDTEKMILVDNDDVRENCSFVPPSSNVAGKKRKRAADGITKGLTDMAEAFGTFFENTNTRMAEIGHRIGYAQDLSLYRKQVNAELMDHPLDWEQRLRAATLIVQEAQRVDLFFSFPKRRIKLDGSCFCWQWPSRRMSMVLAFGVIKKIMLLR